MIHNPNRKQKDTMKNTHTKTQANINSNNTREQISLKKIWTILQGQKVTLTATKVKHYQALCSINT